MDELVARFGVKGAARWGIPQRAVAMRMLAVLTTLGALAMLLGSCSLPQVQAEDRLFLPLSADMLDLYVLDKQEFAGAPVGGLSALVYDRPRDRFLALSDDRASRGPARFYTLAMSIGRDPSDPAASAIQAIRIEGVTSLTDADGAPFSAGSIDPEGLALSPRNTVFVSSEGDVSQAIAPFIGEFDRETGRLLQTLPVPSYYLPPTADERAAEPDLPPRGILNNLGFESLTASPNSALASSVEPFRIFTATESNLAQDLEIDSNPNPDADRGPASQGPPDRPTARFLHFLLGDGPPLPVSEHLYPLDPTPEGADYNGLVEMLAIDRGGRFLSLERTFSPTDGYGVKLFQVAMGAATDTAGYATYRGLDPTDPAGGVAPARKRLLLDLGTLGVNLFNLEGMAIGPRLADGSYSLLLVSDDNFQRFEQTQFLLLRLNGYQPG